MKKRSNLFTQKIAALTALLIAAVACSSSETSLKDTFAEDFLIGTAMN